MPVIGTAVAAPGPAATTAAAAPSPASGLLGSPYADTMGRFRVTPPAGWKPGTSTDPRVAVFFADPAPTGNFRSNVNVYVVDSGLSLDATVVGARSELSGLTAYTATTDEPITLADGTAAHLLGGTFRDLRLGLTLRNLQLFTVHDRKAFAVTATATAGDWPEQEQRMRAALVSLTFAP